MALVEGAVLIYIIYLFFAALLCLYKHPKLIRMHKPRHKHHGYAGSTCFQLPKKNIISFSAHLSQRLKASYRDQSSSILPQSVCKLFL